MWRITVFLMLLVSSVPVCWADEGLDLLKRSFNTWREYEELIIIGSVSKIVDGESVDERTVRVIYGASSGPRKQRPMSIEVLVPNPGEPHLPVDEDILHHAFVIDSDGIAARFERLYITGKGPDWVLPSEMESSNPWFSPSRWYVTPRQGIGNLTTFLFNKAIHVGPMGWTLDMRVDLTQDYLRSNKFEVVGEQEYLGFPCKVVRCTSSLPSIGPSGVVGRWEMLVCSEPSLQFLKVTDCENPENTLLSESKKRQVKELAILCGKLFPTRVKYTLTDSNKWNGDYEILVKSVEPLPKNYVGLWNYDRPTGSLWTGNAEIAIRNKIVNRASEEIDAQFHQEPNIVSMIDFTALEREKIKKYFRRNDEFQDREISWTRLTFYALNLLLLGTLGWFGWKRFRNGATSRR